MVFEVTTGLYSDSHKKHINAQCGQNVVLNLEISRVCWYAGDVRVSGLCCGIQFMYLCMYVRMDICRCWKWPPTTLLHTLFRQNWNAVTVIPNFLRNFSYSFFLLYFSALQLVYFELHFMLANKRNVRRTELYTSVTDSNLTWTVWSAWFSEPYRRR